MIESGDVFGLLAALLCLSAVAAALETTPVGRRISGVGFVLVGALAASHFGVIPRSAPLYDAIWTYLVPFAIALFLLKADLVKVFVEGGRVLIGFAIGGVGAAAGALLGALLLDLGPNEPAIAAVFSATYIGGSLNFVAVAEAVRFDQSSELAAALAIDNILGTGFIIFINLIAGWALLQRLYPWRSESVWGAADSPGGEIGTSVTLPNLLSAIAVASVVVAVSGFAAARLGLDRYTLLFITVLMTAVATVGRTFVARLRGEDMIAMIFMYLFFAIIGAGADIGGMLSAAPEMFMIVLMIFAAHLVVLFAAGAVLKLNYAELIVASLACITGPPVAAAIAILMKWRNLVAPGILTGILGYVVGNFAGVGIFKLLGGSLQ
ncbi:DUF819 family protein [Amphiplicatus metriothermophilus]|uniref:Uncharacterized membrane protein n=1 Tax=Amphiplicatus metriothermophilus TaxID=1519374 RepID=A0A239PXW3_9PROT|nr:DUF819 family protein [Amphiplicatus metriothermophilus]MBB5518932.1 putative membrane protein [Amphiplicatus metriothermophilus]SNT74497.1 Uncharacterized membrane protein [Amphiplicatus metriothermophilus]